MEFNGQARSAETASGKFLARLGAGLVSLAERTGGREGATIGHPSGRDHIEQQGGPAEPVGHSSQEDTDPDRGAVDMAGCPVHGSRIAYAGNVAASIPEGVRDLLRSPSGAMAAVLGMLVSETPSTRDAELQDASNSTGFPVQDLSDAATMVRSLDRSLLLPALEIALTTITASDEELREGFAATVNELVDRKGHVDLFRWLLRRSTQRHLVDAYTPETPQDAVDQPTLVEHTAVLYGLFASYNSGGVSEVHESFAAAYARSGFEPVEFTPASSNLTIGRIDRSLDVLARLDVASRTAFVEGALAAIDHDSMASTNEVDLVRVVADVLRVDIPPMVALY